MDDPKEEVFISLIRGKVDRIPVGNPTSVATVELMDERALISLKPILTRKRW